jgi:hypothetical protein
MYLEDRFEVLAIPWGQRALGVQVEARVAG